LHDFFKPAPEWMFGNSVEARNALQKSGKVHPYTCGNDKCRATLRAVESGWICDKCGYEQALREPLQPVK
jgi:ribosomal protein L37AE/L43A